MQVDLVVTKCFVKDTQDFFKWVMANMKVIFVQVSYYLFHICLQKWYRPLLEADNCTYTLMTSLCELLPWVLCNCV